MEKQKSKAALVRELIERTKQNGFAYWPHEPATFAELGYLRGLVGQHNVFNGTNLSVMHERETNRIKVYVRDEKKTTIHCPNCGKELS
jgi:hypothetical protein